MSAASTGPVALLVDDSETVRRSMTMLLESVGWSAVGAENAEGALRWLQEREFALAIIDLRMPGTGGLDLCRLIRAAKLARPPLLFILSGYIDGPSRADAETLADEILDKSLSRCCGGTGWRWVEFRA
jgi:CheY-like chemotaxis protein